MKQKKLVQCKALPLTTTETIARDLDKLVKTLPKECRYKRSATIPEAELIAGERADISLVSVESVDRDNEVVLSKGVEFCYFQKNPVVTFAHKYDELPIGKCQWIKHVPGAIKAKTIYASRPQEWEGQWLPDAVFSMVQEGILRGKSIGFLPTKIRSATQEEINRNPGWKNANAIIEASYLLEYAIAPIPVNQDALCEAVAKGLASNAVLKRLGLYRKPDVSLLKKELESLRLDPDKIIQAIMDRHTA